MNSFRKTSKHNIKDSVGFSHSQPQRNENPIKFSMGHEESTFLLAKQIIPNLNQNDNEYKIAVIGGSEGSTGNVYYSALSALRIGASEVHIFCEKAVGAIINSFNPEIYVHAILDDKKFSKLIQNWMHCNVFIVGPSLGNSSVVVLNVQTLMKILKENEKLVIVCSGGLHAILEKVVIMQNYKYSILIMNNKDFLNQRVSSTSAIGTITNLRIQTYKTILDLPSTIIRLDTKDIIFNSYVEAVCSAPSIAKVVDANGDVLSGVLSMLFYWGCLLEKEADLTTVALTSCFAACKLMRECNERAFKKFGRAMSKQNVVDEIGRAFRDLFENRG